MALRCTRGARPRGIVLLDRPWLAIVNPAAAGGRALGNLRAVEDEGDLVFDVVKTCGPHDATQVVGRSETGDYAGVVAFGGDGTVHEVVQGLMRLPAAERPTLGVMPCGTGNSLARDLGAGNLRDAAATLRQGHRRHIDLAQVEVDGTPVYCVNVVGWGAIARINRRAERLRWAKDRRYDLASIIELLQPRPIPHGRAIRDGQREDMLLGVACLTEHIGRGMRMAPGAKLDDGLIDLVEIRRGSRMRLAGLLSGVFRGTHLRSPLVQLSQVTSLEIDLEPNSFIVLDGEAVSARRVVLEVLPRALEVFAAPAHENG